MAVTLPLGEDRPVLFGAAGQAGFAALAVAAALTLYARRRDFDTRRRP